MKKTITFYDFQRAFINIGRKDSFSCDGLKALYDYLCDFEDGTGEELELDVIALCCDFTEYEDIQEYIDDYQPDIDKSDFDDDEDYIEAVKEEIENKTTLISIDDENFIIQTY